MQMQTRLTFDLPVHRIHAVVLEIICTGAPRLQEWTERKVFHHLEDVLDSKCVDKNLRATSLTLESRESQKNFKGKSLERSLSLLHTRMRARPCTRIHTLTLVMAAHPVQSIFAVAWQRG